jgi:hypothetical protein
VDVATLIASYPRLYHMAEDGSWPSIRAHGLLSTRALLERFEVPEPRRSELLRHRRPESVSITHPRFGSAVVRDNKPISDAKLAPVLDGMTLAEWYELLNSKVFFWVREQRLAGLLAARAYRDRAHTVIVVDTASLIRSYAMSVTLTSINTGSTAYTAARRGVGTFQAIADYPYEERHRARGPDAIVELAVADRVPGIERYALRVERRDGTRVRRLWPART